MSKRSVFEHAYDCGHLEEWLQRMESELIQQSQLHLERIDAGYFSILDQLEYETGIENMLSLVRIQLEMINKRINALRYLYSQNMGKEIMTPSQIREIIQATKDNLSKK